MKKTKWIAIAVVLGIGLAFEGLKKVEPKGKTQIMNELLGDDDYKPFVRAEESSESARLRDTYKNTRTSRGRIQPQRLAGTHSDNARPPQADGSLSFETIPGVKKKSKKEDSNRKEEKLVSEDEPCAEEDEECREAIAKKKAEERKKEAKKQAENNDNTAESDDENTQPDEEFEVAAPVTGPGGQIGTRGDQTAETPEDELINFWVSQLSRAPNRKLANQFAGMRQAKQISNTVYSEVINQLLEDPRESIQLQATYLLASFQSAESFARLVEVAEGAVFGSNLNKTSERYLANYKKVNNLKHLNRVLGSSTDTLVLKKAIQLVQESAKANLSGELNAQGQSSATLDRSTAKFYRGFLDLLEEIAQSVNDSATINLASSTLAQLEEILPPEESEASGEVALNSKLI